MQKLVKFIFMIGLTLSFTNASHAQISIGDLKRGIDKVSDSNKKSETTNGPMNVKQIKDLLKKSELPETLTYDEQKVVDVTKNYKLNNAIWAGIAGGIAGCIVAKNNGVDCETGAAVGGTGGAFVGKTIGGIAKKNQMKSAKDEGQLKLKLAYIKEETNKIDGTIPNMKRMAENSKSRIRQLNTQLTNNTIDIEQYRLKTSEEAAFQKEILKTSSELTKHNKFLKKMEKKEKDWLEAHKAEINGLLLQNEELTTRVDEIVKVYKSTLQDAQL